MGKAIGVHKRLAMGLDMGDGMKKGGAVEPAEKAETKKPAYKKGGKVKAKKK